MPYNPCGRVVDIGRRAHDEQCRFFNDSDRVDEVSFVEAAPDAPAIDFWSMVCCAQNDPVKYPYDAIGTLDKRPFNTTLAKAPKGLLFDHVCGTTAEFENGAHYDPDAPPIPVGANGYPLCCSPPPRIRGGPGVGGRALYRVYRPLVTRGGPGIGGQAIYHVAPPSDPTAGGLELGGEAGDVLTYVDPTAGGLEFGGEAGDIFNGPGQWIQGEAGHWTFHATETRPHLIECWAPGGGGGETGTITPDDGGGGGSYASAVLDLVAGTDYDVFVGAGGAPGFGAVPATDPTYFGDGSEVNAGGGDPGALGGGPGMPIHGTTGFQGGRGAERGGGSSAGRFSNGNDATGDSGGAPVTDGGAGGDAEAPGASPGGGGGGGDTGLGGFGGTGLVIITWPPPH